MRQTIQKFGLYAFTTAVVLFLAGLVFGRGLSFGTQEVIGYATILVSLSLVYFAMRHFRDTVNHGVLSFGKALGIGLLISAFAALGVAVVDWIYTSFINPDFFADYTRMMEEQGRGDEVMQMSSGLLAAVMFFTVFIIGIIVSLVSALILQRKP